MGEIGFSVGDTIAINLPGGGYGLAVIGRLNHERMFCTTFEPRFPSYPDSAALRAWKPEAWSSWVADTLGLRDGSWVKVEEPSAMADTRHIDVRRLPRFKFESGKTGKPGLAEYDPDTLHVRRLIESPDPEEYRGAPTLLPQDATTFEIAVSRLMGSPCELPCTATVQRLNNERLVVAMLRECVTDTALTLVFEHVLAFRRGQDAKRTRMKLLEGGFDVSEPIKAGLFSRTILEVRLPSKAEYPLVREDVTKMRALAAQHGAEYDGFGAQAV
ncbi:MAG: ribonuclease E inhibitor RraB [Vulcanimicrobiaceae bacterium]